MERRLIIPQPTAESTFDYILPKAALKASALIPLLCRFSHNQEWLLFANDKFNFFSLFFLTPTKQSLHRQLHFMPASDLIPIQAQTLGRVAFKETLKFQIFLEYIFQGTFDLCCDDVQNSVILKLNQGFCS